jgi:ubiquinone/menaquinone biosynthesis C-methylase UbiE
MALEKQINPSGTIYNTIGKEYDNTRTADPYIAERVFDLLTPKHNGRYLDIGCGTGNYLAQLSQMGLAFFGIDPSEIMLQKAANKNCSATLICAKAEAIPLPDGFFDGAIALFTFHHWNDKAGGLKELHRVLKPGSKLVFLTFTGEQMRHYWLNHYFPIMMKRSWELVPEIPGMEKMLDDCGFKLATVENYFVQDDLKDRFLYSYKKNPAQYLLPEVRANISSFSAFCDATELHHGLALLQDDINSGAINDIMRQYESNKGDYVFLVAERME